MQGLVLCKEAVSYIWLIPSIFSLFFNSACAIPVLVCTSLILNCSESTVYLRLGGGWGGRGLLRPWNVAHAVPGAAGRFCKLQKSLPPPSQPHPSPLPTFRLTPWILTENVRRFNSFSKLMQKYFAAFQKGFQRRSYLRDKLFCFSMYCKYVHTTVLCDRCSTWYCVCKYEYI